MQQCYRYILPGIWIIISLVQAQQDNRVDLGIVETGAAVSFVRSAEGAWGIEISGGTAPGVGQTKPARIEIFRGGNDNHRFSAGYQSVRRHNDALIATAVIHSDLHAVFQFEDCWTIVDSVLSLNRTVVLTGTEKNAGFYSSIHLTTDASIQWKGAKYLVPTLLYGEPHTRPNALGGSDYYNARHFSIREDYLSAPLFGMYFHNGNWIAMLDPTPNGATTQEETTASAATPIIDERIQFGALDVHELTGGGIDLGFRMPGTTDEFSGGRWEVDRRDAAVKPVVRGRYNPVKNGFAQSYQVEFRFGKDQSFRAMERNAWRWAWQSLNPTITPIDVEVVRRTLIDHLADQVLTYDGRVGLPFVVDAVSGKPGSFRPAVIAAMFRRFYGGNQPGQNHDVIEWAGTMGIDIDSSAAELDIWPKIVIGFCGKNIEAAEQFIMESDRDSGPRGRRLKDLGNEIVESLVRIVPSSPPSGEGYDIRTGKPSAVHGGTAFTLRSWAEDMRTMVDLIRYERAHGRKHPAWFHWAKAYTDWLITQQRDDGSFPMEWLDETGAVKKGTPGVTSYAAVPLLVKMSEETGDKKYLSAAIQAADYIWKNFGSKCVYLGATGTPDVADKESGMLSMEAFLSLYKNTKDKKWLDYARAAGDYTESWIWIWNVPMPIGANYADLGWKPGVPTVGVNGIGSNVEGHVDEYLDWAVTSYAELYKYTGDAHYLDVARVLLHDTKSMLALPGRTYDLKGPGWQQEHWRMGPNVRGIGAHRTWLPWISINHLHGIIGLEELDPELFHQLSKVY